jgi:quercetin dioxygenase-like cupin family protein
MGKRKKAKWQKVKGADFDTLHRFLADAGQDGEPGGSNPESTEIRIPLRRGYRIENWNQPYSPNPAMLRYTLITEGYNVFQWSDAPGSVYATHSHDTDQSHWMVSGTLELTIAGYGTVVLEAGDRDFMPADTYHSAIVLGDEPAIYLVGEMIV